MRRYEYRRVPWDQERINQAASEGFRALFSRGGGSYSDEYILMEREISDASNIPENPDERI